MSSNRRMILNILATYERSLYGLARGLFSIRWALMSLKEMATDYRNILNDAE